MRKDGNKLRAREGSAHKGARGGWLSRATSPRVRALVEACRSHATDLIRSARTVLEVQRLPNIAYHLAALAMEEIGKAHLVIMGAIAKTPDESHAWPQKHAEDHVKKLFWALWGPSLGKQVITKEQIESFQGLAQRIHETRLGGLYVCTDADAISLPKETISEQDAQSLISLATAVTELNKCHDFADLTKQEVENLSWFLTATEDPEKRKLILGAKSMKKLVELGRPQMWIKWLKDQFDEAEAEGRACAESELKRPKPLGKEAGQEKWKVKIRFYTNSHSIRPRPLSWWNGVSDWIKLYPVGNAKDQLIAEFTFLKSVPVQSLRSAAWAVAQKFITALSIGSMGYFWWYVPVQISRFYENIRDLEADMDLILERSPVLQLDWKRDVLSERFLERTALCFGMLPHLDERERHGPFAHYLTALALLGKSDIHLQFEANAFEEFYQSLKTGMRVYGDWDGTEPFTPAFGVFLTKVLPDKDDQAKYLKLGKQSEAESPTLKGITLSEVGFMKLLCDYYFIRAFERLAKERAGAEKASGESCKNETAPLRADNGERK